jgi:hypothetical protein
MMQLLKGAKLFLRSSQKSALLVASFAGQLNYVSSSIMALLGLAKTLCQISARLARWKGWYKFLHLGPTFYKTIEKVIQALDPLWPSWRPNVGADRPTCTLTTDASQHGWGGELAMPAGLWPTFLHRELQLVRPQAPFAPGDLASCSRSLFQGKDLDRHITWKECQGSVRLLEAVRRWLPANCRVVVRTDCSVNVAVLNKGSTKWYLNEPARRLRTELARMGCQLEAVWIPGSTMGRVDALSRVVEDKHDYRVLPEIFRQACWELQFQPQIDAFATDVNHKLPRFWARRPVPGAEACNALIQD